MAISDVNARERRGVAVENSVENFVDRSLVEGEPRCA
jgi:hypothetical protein